VDKLVPECQTIMDFAAARDNECGSSDDHSSKAPVKLPPPTCTNAVFTGPSCTVIVSLLARCVWVLTPSQTLPMMVC